VSTARQGFARNRRRLTLWPCHCYRPSHINEGSAMAKNLEKSLEDIEKLVEELESGDLPLETAMKKFEEGIKLTRSAQALLKDAEQKVEILLKNAGGEDALEPFATEDE
jgi:exodeoxyribonuclease VII small subunit